MTDPPFTLVHQPPPAKGKALREMEQVWIEEIGTTRPGLAESLQDLHPTFRRTLLFGFAGAATASPDPTTEVALGALDEVVADLSRVPGVVTVGIWDLGATVARLPDVILAMNLAQPALTFFEVHAAIPGGMISRPERVAAWARRGLGRPLTRAEREDIRDNVIDSDFFDRAERIRKDLGIEYLVGVTPSMVAWESEDELSWNYFSTSLGRCLLVSAFGVREYADRAGRPFEVGIALLVLAQLLVERNGRLRFHEDRGCVFDENVQRDTLVRVIRNLEIQPDCRDKLNLRYREAADALMEALRRYAENAPARSAATPQEPGS